MNQFQLDSLYSKFLQLRAPELLQNKSNLRDLTLEDRKCGMNLVQQIKSNFTSFSIEQQTILSKFLQRPLLPNYIISPSQHFKIHYANTGVDAIFYDINLLAQALDSSYSFEINYLGYPSPPSDGSEGGDDKYDIYVRNLGNLYGQTTSEINVGLSRWTSYIEIDNDFPWYSSANPPKDPIDAARVTVAHEFHHSIQMGNYAPEDNQNPFRSSDVFFYELTSTSMEEFVFDTVNDYYIYMNSYFVNPEGAMPSQNGYNLAIWNIYLQKRFGFGIIKQQWELMPSINAILTINNTILGAGSTFPGELNKFAIWTYYTNVRTIPGQYFEEAANYPLIVPTSKLIFNPPQQTADATSKPAANNFIKFTISGSGDSLYALITNGDAIAALQNPIPSISYSYTLYSNSTSGERQLTENYSSTFSTNSPASWSVSEIYNNLLVRSDSLIFPVVEVDESLAFPNPFNYSSVNGGSVINIALNMQNGVSVDFNVYTSGLKEVYSGNPTVGTLINNSPGIYWDGLDNSKSKLGSGVYIYIIKQGDEVIKGKVVIFNE
jgi:hypothetical protein